VINKLGDEAEHLNSSVGAAWQAYKDYEIPRIYNERSGKKMASESIWDKFDKSIDTKGLAVDVENAAENGDSFREVPYGHYEVEVTKLELIESKKGDPMVTIWFKILEGEYKGNMIFMNQVVTRGFQIHIVNEVLRALCAYTDMKIEFINFRQYGELLMDVFEGINGKFEFVLVYEKGRNDFSTYQIDEVFVLE